MSKITGICILIMSLVNLVFSNVPVLLWESSKSDRISKFPAMSTISSDNFKEYIMKKVHGEKKPLTVVIFKEESLAREDFMKQDGQTAFPQLMYITQNSPNTEFLPSVQNPIAAVNELTKIGYTPHTISMDKNDEMPDGCGKVIDVKLEEATFEEGRLELLRKHDKTMAEIYSQLLSKCSHVIAMVSGLQSSWNDIGVYRVRRSLDDGQNYTSVKNEDYLSKDALMLTKSPPILMMNNEKKVLKKTNTLPGISGDRSKYGNIKLVLKFPPETLTFNFDNQTSGYWYLRSLLITGDNETLTMKPNKEIYAPLGMSYHSGSPVIFKNGSNTLTFNDLQVQAFYLNPGRTNFTEAVDDVMFFTPPIWSGIFVTFLLAIIFSWGISMIMDIHTMDQFDDPKGKTITVSATD